MRPTGLHVEQTGNQPMSFSAPVGPVRPDNAVDTVETLALMMILGLAAACLDSIETEKEPQWLPNRRQQAQLDKKLKPLPGASRQSPALHNRELLDNTDPKLYR